MANQTVEPVTLFSAATLNTMLDLSLNDTSLTDRLNQTGGNRMLLFAKQHPALTKRNLLIGLSGMLLNLMGIILLALSRKVKFTIKVPLISLAFNDLVFLTNLFATGTLKAVKLTNHHLCWPSIYMGFSSVIISYLNICLLSVHNWIAVFYPLHSNLILTPAKTCLFTALVWIVGCLIGLACTGIQFQPDILCIGMAPMPMYGVALLGGTCSVCASCVTVLNLKIFIKVRQSNRGIQPLEAHPTTTIPTTSQAHQSKLTSLSGSQDDSPYNSCNTRNMQVSSTEYESEQTDLPIHKIQNEPKSPNNLLVPATSPNKQDSDRFVKAKGTFFSDTSVDIKHINSLLNTPTLSSHRCDYERSLDNHILEKIGDKSQFPLENSSTNQYKTGELSVSQTRPSASRTPVSGDSKRLRNSTSLFVITSTDTIQSPTSAQERKKKLIQKVMASEADHSSDDATFSAENGKLKHSTQTAHLHQLGSNAKAVSADSSSGNSDPRHEAVRRTGLQRHGRVKLRNSLTMITMWCCFVTSPFLIYALVASLGVRRGEFAQSGGGIFLSSLVTVNALTNPLLYAWRFVAWSGVWNKLKTMATPMVTPCRCKRWS